MARFELIPDAEPDVRALVKRRSQEALDRTFAAVAGQPEAVVGERIMVEFRNVGLKGLDSSHPMVAAAVSEISAGRTVRAS